jgi:ATP-dependent Lon protease
MLPVGGIKMKVLAAHRAGLKTVILPKRNERDLDEVPDDVRSSIRFVPVEWIDEALEVALVPDEREAEMPDGMDDQSLLQQRRLSLN